MSEDDQSKSSAKPNLTAKELGAFSFRPESIEEICQLATVAWFPLEKTASRTKKQEGPDKLTGYEVSFVDTAKALSSRARKNDHDALLRLVIMAMAAQLELWQLTKDSTVLQRASQHSMFWFLPRSPVEGLGKIFKEFQNLTNAASILLNFRKIKGNLDVPANACAFKLLAYMICAKRRLISNPRHAGWVEECSYLPKLSETTWNEKWWNLGKTIAKDMFPELDYMFFGAEVDPKNKCRNYSAAIHQLGLAFENIWPLFKGIEDATMPLNVKETNKNGTA